MPQGGAAQLAIRRLATGKLASSPERANIRITLAEHAEHAEEESCSFLEIEL